MTNLVFKIKKTIKKNKIAIDFARKIRDFLWEIPKRRCIDNINKNYSHLFEELNISQTPTTENHWKDGIYPVWICWLQGEKNMPELVKMCYASLLKNADGHKVNLITIDNYSEFINIPDYIVEKYKKGWIGNAHFTDILRVFLLSKHGGLYLDATIYTSNKLPSFDGIPYLAGKWKNDIENIILTEYFIYSLPNNILMCLCRDIFTDYLEKKNKFMFYFMLAMIMFTAYEKVKSIRDLLNNMPSSKRGMLDLWRLLNNEYNKDEYESLCNEQLFHKLNNKEDFRKNTINGKLTFYGYLYQKWQKEKE